MAVGVPRWISALGRYLSLSSILLLSSLLRVLLLCYGEWQDRSFAVKFTDVDYHVFSDAAGHVTEGRSPFLRPTYRYTPLLAILLTPNHYLFASFGKLLFIACDLVSGWLIHRILTLQGVRETLKLISCSVWLLNPLTATVSSRGNAESLLAVLILAYLYFIMCKQTVLSALLYGLAVHMKIFPIIYSLSLFLLLDGNYSADSRKRSGDCPASHQQRLISTLKRLFNRQRVIFTATSALTFLVITAVLFLQYGREFIQEAYLYHVTRRDTRHNFSVYFYLLYLLGDGPLSFPVGILAFLPQVVLLLVATLCLYRDTTFCTFVQTFTFVTFNKVCTSQYFLWYLCLLPLILPFSRLGVSDAIILPTLWFIGQGLWLAPAYYLEFQGYNTFLLIWVAGILFFGINVFILARIILHHSFLPTFTNGRVSQQHHSNKHKKID